MCASSPRAPVLPRELCGLTRAPGPPLPSVGCGKIFSPFSVATRGAEGGREIDYCCSWQKAGGGVSRGDRGVRRRTADFPPPAPLVVDCGAPPGIVWVVHAIDVCHAIYRECSGLSRGDEGVHPRRRRRRRFPSCSPGKCDHSLCAWVVHAIDVCHAIYRECTVASGLPEKGGDDCVHPPPVPPVPPLPSVGCGENFPAGCPRKPTRRAHPGLSGEIMFSVFLEGGGAIWRVSSAELSRPFGMPLGDLLKPPLNLRGGACIRRLPSYI